MDRVERLNLLSSQMDFEPDGQEIPGPGSRPVSDAGWAPSTPELPACHTRRKPEDLVISHVTLPNGRTLPLLKTLLTSACERNCTYCPFRAGRDYRRETFRPEELASVFMQVHRAGVVKGLFLSSGVAGGAVRTQDRLIDTVEILRHKYQYQGYVHLKMMPGAEMAQIERVMRLADRVSVNLEAPNPARLASLAPRKAFEAELMEPLRMVEKIRRSLPGQYGWNGRWPSVTTQFVVGAAGENDLELLQTSETLFNDLGLSRVYYSAFRPVSDTPLEHLPPESPLRQQRLYEASFLLRGYGFSLDEIPFDKEGKLPQQKDPKTAWAEANLAGQPLEINKAGRAELLRIPGFGPKSVAAILDARHTGRIRSTEDLHRLGINPKRALPYLTIDGRAASRQLSFW